VLHNARSLAWLLAAVICAWTALTTYRLYSWDGLTAWAPARGLVAAHVMPTATPILAIFLLGTVACLVLAAMSRTAR
jgi:hypothetical protein